METSSRPAAQRLLKQYGITPRKHWGQNFLVSRSAVRKILQAADVSAGDTVLEIGGGLGALTLPLAERAKRVIVIERDPGLCRVLCDILKDRTNVMLICDDARKLVRDPFFLSSLSSSPRYKLVANLPYGTGTVIFRTLLEGAHPPRIAIVMLQKEVAQRLTVQPPHCSLLGVAIQHLAETKILFRVPKSATWPAPDVESAVVRFIMRMPRVSQEAHAALMETARRGFAHPRKLVLRNIAAEGALRDAISSHCAIPTTARPQELTLAQWECAARHLRGRLG